MWFGIGTLLSGTWTRIRVVAVFCERVLSKETWRSAFQEKAKLVLYQHAPKSWQHRPEDRSPSISPHCCIPITSEMVAAPAPKLRLQTQGGLGRTLKSDPRPRVLGSLSRGQRGCFALFQVHIWTIQGAPIEGRL